MSMIPKHSKSALEMQVDIIRQDRSKKIGKRRAKESITKVHGVLNILGQFLLSLLDIFV